MKLFVHILLAAAIACAAVTAAAQTGVRSFTPKDVQNQPPKPELQAAPPKPEAQTPQQKPDEKVACKPVWTAKKYKSFDSVQNEIRKRYGEVRILRVALCGEGTAAYFQIIILSGQGSVSRVQIAASN